jgi:hypothetical protein
MYHMVQKVDVTVRSAAAPAAVYKLAADSSTWSSWAPITSYQKERAGDANGLGEVRAFRSKGRRTATREEVVELVPDRRVGYVLLSGLAIRDYRAVIDLTPDGDGTSIHWYSSFRPKVPGTGWLYRAALQQAIGAYAKALAEKAGV